MTDSEEKVLRSQLTYQGSFLKVVQDLVENTKGHRHKREYILHPGAAMVIAQLSDGRFVMENQYRHALGKVFLEFPAGKLDKGEEPLAAAQREFKEETGYVASKWTRLGVLHPCIGYSNEFIEVFWAQELQQKGAELDAGENLEVIYVTEKELNQKITAGEVTDAKTLSALLMFEKHRGSVGSV